MPEPEVSIAGLEAHIAEMRNVISDIEPRLHSPAEQITITTDQAKLLLACALSWCMTTEALWLEPGVLRLSVN